MASNALHILLRDYVIHVWLLPHILSELWQTVVYRYIDVCNVIGSTRNRLTLVVLLMRDKISTVHFSHHILRACPDGLVLTAVCASAAELQGLFRRYVVRCRRVGNWEVIATGQYTWALHPCWSYNDAIACYSACFCCLVLLLFSLTDFHAHSFGYLRWSQNLYTFIRHLQDF